MRTAATMLVFCTRSGRTWPSAVILLSLAFALTGCVCTGKAVREQDATVSLTWRGFDGKKAADPETAVYLLDGKSMGRGRIGFEAVLQQLATLPKDTQLNVFPDHRVLGRLAPLGNQSIASLLEERPESVPFRLYSDGHEAFRETVARSGLVVWYFAYPPGEFVSEDGEDLKVPGP